MAGMVSSLAALLWPIVVAVLVFALLPALRKLLTRSDSVDIEVAGAKISIQNASEELRKQINDLQDRLNALEAARGDVPTPSAEALPVAPVPTRRVLWVEDRPEANVYERARLEEAGRPVVRAATTREALQQLDRGGPFSVIVSDLGRVEEDGTLNRRAGLDLLREIRAGGDETPVIFYTSDNALRAVRAELEQATNVSYTASPSELMRLLRVSGGG